MKSLLLVLAMLGAARADTFPKSGPCDDVEACEKACAKNQRGTCYFGGALVLQSPFSKDRHERALALFERGCAKGDAESCYRAANITADMEYVPKAPPSAKTLAAHKRACNKQHARSCANYAVYLVMVGDESSKQLAAKVGTKATTLLEQRCTKNKVAPACFMAASRYETGIGVTKDEKKGTQLRERGCKLDKSACDSTRGE